MDAATIITIVSGIFTAGAAWGGATMALNGTRKRVIELVESFEKHVEADDTAQRDTIDRLARIETKLEG